MLSVDRIRQELGNVLDQTDCSAGKRVVGKVRDSYLLSGGRRLLVTTDRVSAFDCVLGTIPFKGQVLNQLAAFWFERTAGIAPNHVIGVPDPNLMLVAECEQLPLEFIVRGYITGVTKTSAWVNYDAGMRTICGNKLPDGLRKDQRLAHPILTPTTKHELHDRNISRDEAITEGLISADLFDEAARLCLRLYQEGVAQAAARGLILVDTKYELGLLDGRLVVSDEIHTPDSSRYWFADSYESCFREGREQRKLDKEYVREWLAARGFRGDGPPPVLTDEVRIEAARRYLQAYELITGLPFAPVEGPIGERVRRAIETAAACAQAN
ncbi:MAG: phosphoribosylaminoimidazolesuccinocarboxamide synthase [Lentisphaerae bacterium]|nr:phosphoribosylaminoimidazolesuccinocarboxamide synthase [Lentisphaerota bacterium]